jgi:hypothetical protein
MDSQGGLLPARVVLAKVRHGELHPLVAKLIKGTNKVDGNKTPRTQAVKFSTVSHQPPPSVHDLSQLQPGGSSFELMNSFKIIDLALDYNHFFLQF